MERQTPETELPPTAGAAQNEAAALAAVGAKLREARERGGMSVDDVANRLKFAPRQIEALEEGNLAQLPERAFIRGFIRSYAKLVHLDDKPLLAALPGAPAPAPAAGAAGAGPSHKTAAPPLLGALEAHRTNLIWAGAALVLVVIIIAIWPSGGKKPEPGLEASRNAPAASAVPEVASAPAPAPVVAPAPVPTPAPAPRAHEPESRHVAPAPAPTPVKKPRKPAEAIQPASGVPAAGQAPAQAASGVSATEKPRAAAGLRLVCDEDSWVEVKDETGAVLLSQLCLTGSEQRVTSALPLSVVVGNAKGVKVYYRGRQIDLAPHTHADAARLKLR